MDDTLLKTTSIADFIPQYLLVHFEAEHSEKSGESFWKINTSVIQTVIIKQGQLNDQAANLVHLDKMPFCLLKVRFLMRAEIKSHSKVALTGKRPFYLPRDVVAADISVQHVVLISLD